MRLRPYQLEAIQHTHDAWARGVRRPAVVLPTGLGKTVIFADLIRGWCSTSGGMAAGFTGRPDGKLMVLVHRDELVNQTVEKLRSVLPDGTTVGVIKAERNELHADVYVASVQTLARERRITQVDPWRVGLIVVDECHHAAADSYLRILQYFGAFGSGAVAVGFTATMERGDSRLLGNVWQEVVYTKDILWGIAEKYLRDVRGIQVGIDGLDLATVARSGGDFQDTSLGDALMLSGAGDHVATAIQEHAPGRQGILFAPNVASTEYFSSALNGNGIRSAVITGETPREQRREYFGAVRARELDYLSNCMVLTEGFDMPQLSCAVIARPTSKAGLYVQMAGRVLRPWPGISDALILDLAGNAGRHKLATIADLTAEDVTVKDGESLAEALDRTMCERDQAAKRTPKARKLANQEAWEVDLFHLSHNAWLRTHAGVWFIPGRALTWFLWPEGARDDGREVFRVGRFEGRSTVGGVWLGSGLDLEMAMAKAEEDAAQLDPSISMRGAPWRRSKAMPDSPQWLLAEKLGMDLDPKNRYSKGEISDYISVAFTSRVLDRKGRR